jgi:uncharacterized protein
MKKEITMPKAEALTQDNPITHINLFPEAEIVGVFRGFCEGGLEFHADLILPYRNEFQSWPMHGQFVLIQLETPDEAVLGRITSFSSEGKLSFGSGEEFNIRAMREGRPIPEDLREQYLKYKVNIRVLGVLRNTRNGGLTFVPSHRRLPHVGSIVAFPSAEVLCEVAGHNIKGAEIGHFALGEYIYAYGDKYFDTQDWMQIQPVNVLIKFPIENLVSRRSFIFARAGFGKSNLNKLLFSKLYESTPMIEKRGGTKVPVGTIIFDPDGEYFWPDDKGKPGLCDVPKLEDKLVIFTSRRNKSPFYQSFVAGGIKLDIRRLRPSDVIAIALGPERQEQQNVRKLRALNQQSWEELVNIIDNHGNQTPIEDINRLLNLERAQEAEALAARANMTSVVRMLHDKSSQLMDILLKALSEGKLCVIDFSQLRGGQALVLSGLILRRIFDRNQEEFTKSEPKTIPTIAVIEEAQAVLSEKATSAEPYITWVKEGRKYDLGALMITQQPGSIPVEILSQGDNWFIFHLLSSADLTSVRKANAHFSEDLLSALLNEPIVGQGVFWSSVKGTPYPVPIRVLSFEKIYPALDLAYDKPAANTYAMKLKKHFDSIVECKICERDSSENNFAESNGELVDVFDEKDLEPTVDILQLIEQRAINSLQDDKELLDKVRKEGIAWGAIKAFFMEVIPNEMDDRGGIAFQLVSKVLTQIFGPQNEGWHSYKHPQTGATYVKAGRG